ncbi:MAG: HDOD domain-containing protein [Proteobacteria bacterium]|nr:HDOD domain-containing protein [Pseudomonadota bacterium]
MTATAPVAAPAMERRVGRFELQRLLGHGAHASVWLAHDPRLKREVAVKLLEADAANVADPVDPAAAGRWLQAAQAAARLAHPHVVPMLDAGVDEGQPYLVFEYVPGGSLAQRLARSGKLAPRAAAELMVGVLDALAAAHEQGILHRDLKPSSVLLGKDGRARVMDFGIAARAAQGADARIVGTPGYLSPEAARGEPANPRMDVFAAGALLGELLSGQRLLHEADPLRALQRVQDEDLLLPADAAIDDHLRSVVQRALARQPERRFDSAADLRDALAAWLAAGSQPAPASAGHARLDLLLRRMREKSDFPALGDAVVRIQRTTNSETESLSSLAADIQQDVALTNKLLRLVNSVTFMHAGGGSVATVSRAVQLIGFGGVRNMALSLVLLDHMQNKPHAEQLKGEFLRALMAGSVAGALAPLLRESEEVFIGALFQNLGRLLTEFYFPEEAQQIRERVAAGDDREDAAREVLGLGLQDLGAGVAKAWDLPESLQRTMRAPEGELPPRAVEPGAERLRWIGRCAGEMSDCLLAHEPAQAEAALAELAARQAPALGLPPQALLQAAATARGQISDFARAMGLDLARGPAARRLGPDGAPLEGQAEAAPPRSSEAVTKALSAGIADIAHRLASGDFKLNELLQSVLQTMRQALDLQRIVLCLRDPRTDTMTGRLALGAGGAQACKPFAFALRDAPGAPLDLFAAICRKGADTVIADATRAGRASRLPPWYVQSLNAPSFLLLPLMMKTAPFGLIYADAARPGALAPEEKELALLRELRNQVVMAFRQVGA